MKKFEETGVVSNIDRSVYYRFARSAEHIDIVSESVAENRNVSIPQRKYQQTKPSKISKKKREYKAVKDIKIWKLGMNHRIERRGHMTSLDLNL